MGKNSLKSTNKVNLSEVLDGKDLITLGLRDYLEAVKRHIGDPDGHFKETPERFVRMLDDCFWGIHEDPAAILQKSFTERKYDQMVLMADIDFVSYCRHHLLPFYGHIHFGYLPKKKIVGLSKIPRMIGILAARPQLQENLADDIVRVFDETVKPLGCGVVIRAYHSCISARGIRKNPITQTVALRGEFNTPHVKAEFLEGIR